MTRIAFACALVGVALNAVAQSPAVGLWKTIDDKTGKPLSIVRLAETDGELTGTIEQIFTAPGEDPDPKCEHCEGKFKGQRVLGMTFMWGFKRNGDAYGSGKILDPEEGRVYSCRVELSADGDKLNVRGYVGIPLFGRTQVWLRQP